MKFLSSTVLISVVFFAGCGGKTPVSGPPIEGQTQPASGAQTQKYNIYEAKGEFRVDSEMLRKFFRYIHDLCWKIPISNGRFTFGQYPMRSNVSADNREGVSYPVIQVYNVSIPFQENLAVPESSVVYNPVFIVAYAVESEKIENELRSWDAVGFGLNGFRYFYLKYCAEEYVVMANEAENKHKTEKAEKYRKLAAECAAKMESFRDEFADGLIYGEYEVKMYDNTYAKAYYVLVDLVEQYYGPKIRRVEEKKNTVQWKKQKIDPAAYDVLRTEYRLKNGGVSFPLVQDGQTLNLLVKYWAEPDTMNREKYSEMSVSEPSKKWNYVFLGVETKDSKQTGNRIRETFADQKSSETKTYIGRVIVGGLWAEPFTDEFQSRIVLVKAPLSYPMQVSAAIMLVRRDGGSTVVFIKDAARMSLELRELPPEETARMLQVPDEQKLLISAEVEKSLRDEKKPDFQ